MMFYITHNLEEQKLRSTMKKEGTEAQNSSPIFLLNLQNLIKTP